MSHKRDKNTKVSKQLGLRATLLQEKILDLASELDAKSAGRVRPSRSEFCLAASLEKARQVILAAGQKVPGE